MKKLSFIVLLFVLFVSRANAVAYLDDYMTPHRVELVTTSSTTPLLATYFNQTNMQQVDPRPYYSRSFTNPNFYMILSLTQSLLANKYYLVTFLYAAEKSDGSLINKSLEDSVTNGNGSVSHFYSHPATDRTSFRITKYTSSGYEDVTHYATTTTFLIKTNSYANVLKFQMKDATSIASFSFYGYVLTYVGDDGTSIEAIQSKVNELISKQNTTNTKIDNLNTNVNNQFKAANELAKTNSTNEINAANSNSQKEISAANTNSTNQINAMNKNQEQANKNSQNEVNAMNKNTQATEQQTAAITNSEVTVDGSFFSGFDNNTHGLTAIITSPLQLIGSITSSTCSPLGIPMPFGMPDAQLPCMKQIYNEFFGDFFTLYQTLTFGMISYWVCVQVFAMVKGFKDPDSDKIEVLDL